MSVIAIMENAFRLRTETKGGGRQERLIFFLFFF